MVTTLFLQLALATAGTFSSAKADINTTPTPITAPAPTTRVVAGADDRNALDILNNTRPDILQRGAVMGCPAVTTLYVNGTRRKAPASLEGFSTLPLYVVGDNVTVMLPRAVADALRMVDAKRVRDIRYVDCTVSETHDAARNALYVTTK